MAAAVESSSVPQAIFQERFVKPESSPYRTDLALREAKSFAEFWPKFAPGGTYHTEQAHPKTKNLSQILAQNPVKGLSMLQEVDTEVVPEVEKFAQMITELNLAPELAQRLRTTQGRFIFMGAGSSARAGLDIAAKCAERFPEYADRFHAILAGGDTAFLRAKEGFEDKDEKGIEAIKDCNVGPDDTVILISASGSAPYLVGAANEAANRGAKALYLYNNPKPSGDTQKLFTRENNKVVPLLATSMPAIAGSTRLQPAVMAEACLGILFAQVLQPEAKEYADELVRALKQVNELIKEKLEEIAEFVKEEAEVLDRNGNITTLATTDKPLVGRMAIIDNVEIPPTFSMTRINQESRADSKDIAEYRCYLIGPKTNEEAFSSALGRKVRPADQKEAKDFLLAASVDGVYSFAKRDAGLTIGVASVGIGLEELVDTLKRSSGSSRLIISCPGALPAEYRTLLSSLQNPPIVFEHVPQDAFGLAETILWKQVLHLKSNGTACLLKKLLSNRMIDVSPANMKLLNRAIGLVMHFKELFGGKDLDNETLYHYIVETTFLWNKKEARSNKLSVVKLVLAMLKRGKTPDHFDEVYEELVQHQGDIEKYLSIKH